MLAGWTAIATAILTVAGLIAPAAVSDSRVPEGLGWLGIAGGAGMAVAALGLSGTRPGRSKDHPGRGSGCHRARLPRLVRCRATPSPAGVGAR